MDAGISATVSASISSNKFHKIRTQLSSLNKDLL